MRIDVGVPSLDPSSRMYEPSHLARVCLEVAKDGLSTLPGDGRVLLLLPGFTTSGAASGLLADEAMGWPADFRERVQISALGLQAPPEGSDELPAAVIVAGLCNAADADDPSFRNGRAWLRLAPRCAVLCVNPESFIVEPVELEDFEQSYCFLSYGITRTAAEDDGAAVGDPESSGVALLRRAAPGPWRLLFDPEGGTSYELLEEAKERPSPEQMEKLLSEAIDNSKGPMLRPSGEGAAASPGGPRQAAGGAAGGGRALSDVERLEAMMGGPAAGEGPPPAAASATDDYLPSDRRQVAKTPAAAAAGSNPNDGLAGRPDFGAGGSLGGDGGLAEGEAAVYDWETLQDTGPNGAIRYYQAEALLRCVALGGAASFDADAGALHVLGDVSRSEEGMGFEVGAAVLMVREEGLPHARLEQLCVQKATSGGLALEADERARRAGVLLARAEAEARARQLTRLQAAGAALGVEEAGWLVEAGFALDVETDGVDLLDRASWPRWCKLL